jgi:glycerol-3-phosphate dehydrogenase
MAEGMYLTTNQLMGHTILNALDRADKPLAFLSGPSFAEEILKGNPTTLVVASDTIFNVVRIQKILSNFKAVGVFTSDKPVGNHASKVISDLNLFNPLVSFHFLY